MHSTNASAALKLADAETGQKPGQRIGKYLITRKLGMGGMGSVYELLQPEIQQRVAAKILHARYAEDPEAVKRFFYEARLVNVIDHPSLVKTFDFGHLPDGTVYIIMEYLDGQSLQERLKERAQDPGRLPMQLTLALLAQVADALRAVHQRGIVHRDLKPANIFLVPDTAEPCGLRARLLDFGVAKIGKNSDALGSTVTQLETHAGMLLGTPSYMAPEQIDAGHAVTGSADIYALGIIAYEMMSGELPFNARGSMEVLAHKLLTAPRPLRQVNAKVPRALEALVMAMLARTPAKRPGLDQILRELAGAWSVSRVLMSGAARWWWTAPALAAALGGLGLLRWERRAPVPGPAPRVVATPEPLRVVAPPEPPRVVAAPPPEVLPQPTRGEPPQGPPSPAPPEVVAGPAKKRHKPSKPPRAVAASGTNPTPAPAAPVDASPSLNVAPRH